MEEQVPLHPPPSKIAIAVIWSNGIRLESRYVETLNNILQTELFLLDQVLEILPVPSTIQYPLLCVTNSNDLHHVDI